MAMSKAEKLQIESLAAELSRVRKNGERCMDELHLYKRMVEILQEKFQVSDEESNEIRRRALEA